MELRLLGRIPFLHALPRPELRRIARIASEKSYAAGERIFSKAESGNCMFVVISGRVRIFTRSGGKKRKTFAYLAPGEFFGEMALVDGTTRSASAEAVTASRLLVIRKSDFKGLLLSEPKLAFYLLRTVCERLRQANEEIESLLFRNMLGRVSRTLSVLGARGRRFQGGRLLKERYTKAELADLVGTTREPLTRAMASLRRAGLVDALQGRIFIRDPRRLAALCRPAGP